MDMDLKWILISTVVLGWALYARPWIVLLQPERQNLTFGAMVLTALMWVVRVHFPGPWGQLNAMDLPIQMSGAALLTAMLGLRPALVVLACACAISSVVLDGDVQQAAYWFVWLAAVPAFLAAGLNRVLVKFLPHNPFIFILGHGYFGGLLSVAIGRLLAYGWLLYEQGRVGFPALDTLASSVALGFAEGFITGLLLAVFVAHRPQWVPTFDDADYLNR